MPGFARHQRMAPVAFVSLLTLLGGCEPEIGRGTYYCGPERLCPPGLACSDTTFTCETEFFVESFVCPEGTEDVQHNELGTAQILDDLQCAQQTLLGAAEGCVPDEIDVDYYEINNSVSCSSDRQVEAKLRFAVAHVPLVLEILDADGDVVSTGIDCTPSGDGTGRQWLCSDFVPEQGAMYIRVRSSSDGGDCGGTCHFNKYTLDVKYLRS